MILYTNLLKKAALVKLLVLRFKFTSTSLLLNSPLALASRSLWLKIRVNPRLNCSALCCCFFQKRIDIFRHFANISRFTYLLWSIL